MENEELRELTASERLTLDEEYQMQISWRKDNDKLTFLVLDLQKYTKTGDEIESLIGDTNIFIQNLDYDDSNQPILTGEVEIMIASPVDRRKGFGYEAMLQMIRYGVDTVKLERLIAKIGIKNEKSIKMFQKLGFKEESRSEVFQEVSMSVKVDESWKSWLYNQIRYSEEKYR